jgi:hypothetical protein
VIDALVSGRLFGAPVERTGKAGSRFVTCKVRVSLRDREALFLNVITFAKPTMVALLALADRDSVALAGELTPTAWIDKEGQPRAGLDLLAHVVLTEYHIARKRRAVRVSDGEAPTDGESASTASATCAGDFDDSIPF